MLPPRLTDRYRPTQDPHFYGFGQRATNTPRPRTSLLRPRDIGAQGDQYRSILLDQLRRRGVNFFSV